MKKYIYPFHAINKEGETQLFYSRYALFEFLFSIGAYTYLFYNSINNVTFSYFSDKSIDFGWIIKDDLNVNLSPFDVAEYIHEQGLNGYQAIKNYKTNLSYLSKKQLFKRKQCLNYKFRSEPIPGVRRFSYSGCSRERPYGWRNEYKIKDVYDDNVFIPGIRGKRRNVITMIMEYDGLIRESPSRSWKKHRKSQWK
jgi:hypothetical protein